MSDETKQTVNTLILDTSVIIKITLKPIPVLSYPRLAFHIDLHNTIAL